MNLYDELMEFLEANNWLSLEDKDNASGVVKSYLKVYKPTPLTDAEVQELRDKAKAFRDKGGDYLTPMETN